MQQDNRTSTASSLILPLPPAVHSEKIRMLPPEKAIAELPKSRMKKEISPAGKKIAVPLLTVSPVPLSLEPECIPLQIELIRDKKKAQIPAEPEMYLAENATNWKASGSRLLADPILKTIVRAGTMITGKIRKPGHAK